MKQLTEFSSRQAASEAAAKLLSDALRSHLITYPVSTLVVSGGTSPRDCLRLMSGESLEWDRVAVTLSDDRCVPPGHADSNERMVREHLLRENAAHADFQSLESDLPEPFAAVLLGMGADGHFASLFSDASNLGEGLDLGQDAHTIQIDTAASPYRRVSMPLARLLKTACLLLLAFGDEKRTLIDEPGETPVRNLFEQSVTPVQIFWAP